MENILNEPEKLIEFVETANKKFFTSLLGKNSALYEDTNDIYIMQHLRTFLQEENFIRVFVHELDKTVVKINMEIYKDRTVKNLKGEHVEIIFEFKKPYNLSDKETENKVTVKYCPVDSVEIIDNDNKIFNYFMKLYSDKNVKFKDIPVKLLKRIAMTNILKKNKNLKVNVTF